MEVQELVKRIPAWVIILATLVFLIVFLERVYLSKEPFYIGGALFGTSSQEFELPEGAILAWNPRVLGPSGEFTGETREIPPGWSYCNGQNGTPYLDRHTLSGVAAIHSAGLDYELGTIGKKPVPVDTVAPTQKTHLRVYGVIFLCKTKQ